MSIVRTKHKRHNFTIIDNTALVDPTLTWKETGLLAFLMTKPDDWHICIKALCNNKVDGRDSVAATLTSLQKKGYVYCLEKRDLGRFSTEYLVFETREDLVDWAESDEGNLAISKQEKHRNGFSGTVKPERQNRNGSTVTANPSQVIIDIDITHEQITEELITEEETPPTSSPAVVIVEEGGSVPDAPQVESALEQTAIELAQQPKALSVRDKSVLEQISPTANRVRQTWQETGFLPKIPLELDAWAFVDIGEEVIKAYRHSGRISTTKRGDIKQDFALYVSSQWAGKDIDYGYDRIRNMEADPKKWEVLASLVAKWQLCKQSGQEINITTEISKRVESERIQRASKRRFGE